MSRDERIIRVVLKLLSRVNTGNSMAIKAAIAVLELWQRDTKEYKNLRLVK